MKKTIKSLLAIAVAALTFHSCADVPAPYQIPDGGGSGGNLPEGTIFKQVFSSDKGDFIIKNLSMAEGLSGSDIWTTGASYLKATTYLQLSGETAKKNHNADSWFISPRFSLKDMTTAYVILNHSTGYLNGAKPATCLKVMVSDNYTDGAAINVDDWKEVEIDNWYTGTSFEFINGNGDLKDFIGKENVHVALRYIGTESTSPTWEIASLTIADAPQKAEEKQMPTDLTGKGTPEEPYTVADAHKIIDVFGSSESPEVYVKGKVVSIVEYNTANKNMTYYISDDGSANGQLEVFRGKYLKNQGFTSESQLSVGDVVVVKGKLVNYQGKTREFTNGNYIYMLNGEGGGDTPSGDAKGSGTQADPFNVAAAIAKCQETGQTATNEEYYVKGIADDDCTIADDNYKNATFDMVDAEGSSERFKAFRVLGPNGQKLKAGYKIPKGATVIVYGKLVNYRGNTPETVQTTSPAYNGILVSVNGQAPELDGQGGGDTPSGDATGTGTQNDPFNVAAAIAKCQETGQTATNEEYYVKGIADADCTIADDNYKNATFDMVDVAGSSAKFKAFRVLGPNGQKLKAGYKIPKGATVIVFSKLVNYRGNTPETVQTTNPVYNGTLLSVNGQAPELDGQGGGESGGESGGGGSAVTSLTNGNFETWANGLPTGWKSASTASTATLEQSTDAHGGTYSCIVKGDEGYNKRLASQEITLAAGTYVFSAWVKATTSDASQARLGYVPIGADGKAGTYIYANYVNLSTSWQQFSQEFTLDSEKKVCLVIMNPKKSNYSSGKDILVDDATLTKK